MCRGGVHGSGYACGGRREDTGKMIVAASRSPALPPMRVEEPQEFQGLPDSRSTEPKHPDQPRRNDTQLRSRAATLARDLVSAGIWLRVDNLGAPLEEAGAAFSKATDEDPQIADLVWTEIGKLIGAVFVEAVTTMSQAVEDALGMPPPGLDPWSLWQSIAAELEYGEDGEA